MLLPLLSLPLPLCAQTSLHYYQMLGDGGGGGDGARVAEVLIAKLQHPCKHPEASSTHTQHLRHLLESSAPVNNYNKTHLFGQKPAFSFRLKLGEHPLACISLILYVSRAGLILNLCFRLV